jgi:hypothetical protein
MYQLLPYTLPRNVPLTGAHPELFTVVEVADPEVTYNLFDFKNYVIKLML